MSVLRNDRELSNRRWWTALSLVEHRVAVLVRPFSLPMLRVSLGVVFVWFGALKAANVTPVAALVAGTVPWVDARWFVPLLGGVEVAVGIALIVGRRLAVVSVVLVCHLAATMLVFVMQPHIAFQHGNPLLLTTEGEFVVKNIVLISSGLVLASRLQAQPVERSQLDLAA